MPIWERTQPIIPKQVGVNKPRTQKSGFFKKPDFSTLRVLGLIARICLSLKSPGL
jgi:hypothetical protein